jgi:hypothetical protein
MSPVVFRFVEPADAVAGTGPEVYTLVGNSDEDLLRQQQFGQCRRLVRFASLAL